MRWLQLKLSLDNLLGDSFFAFYGGGVVCWKSGVWFFLSRLLIAVGFVDGFVGLVFRYVGVGLDKFGKWRGLGFRGGFRLLGLFGGEFPFDFEFLHFVVVVRKEMAGEGEFAHADVGGGADAESSQDQQQIQRLVCAEALSEHFAGRLVRGFHGEQ